MGRRKPSIKPPDTSLGASVAGRASSKKRRRMSQNRASQPQAKDVQDFNPVPDLCEHAQLDPSPGLEIARLEAVRELAASWRAECAAVLGGRKWHAHFEQWLWTARSAHASTSGSEAASAKSSQRFEKANVGTAHGATANSSQESVPVLPVPVAAAAALELARKLERAGMSAHSAKEACSRLDMTTRRLAEQLSASEANGALSDTTDLVECMLAKSTGVASEMASRAPGQRGQDSKTEENVCGIESETQLVLRCRGVELQCSAAHLAKLLRLYETTMEADARAQSADDAAGTQLHAAPFECSASAEGGGPLRVSTDSLPAHFLRCAFCMLARVMALQGGEERAGGMQAACGYGVFDVLHRELGVSMELFASPLNARFSRFCSAALDVDAPFGSIGSFFSPRLTQRLSQTLRDSPFRTAVIHLEQADHGFFEGGQHYRHGLWRGANHDSTVFCLQSAVSAARTPMDASRRAAIRKAFAQPSVSCEYSQLNPEPFARHASRNDGAVTPAPVLQCGSAPAAAARAGDGAERRGETPCLRNNHSKSPSNSSQQKKRKRRRGSSLSERASARA